MAEAATAHDTTTVHFRAGVASAAVLLCTYGVLQFRDGTMVNPHPAFWRLLHALCLCYLILLGVLFVLDIDTARTLLGHLLPQPLTTDFDGDEGANGMAHLLDCQFSGLTLYRQVTSRWFVSHILGWVGYTLLIRNISVCLAVSFLFECIELSLVCYIPEFQECWWDSLILDFALCNVLGMLLGWQILRWLNSRSWEWNEDWDTPTAVSVDEDGRKPKPSRLKQVANKLGKSAKAVGSSLRPFVWTQYEWQLEASLTRYANVCVVVVTILAASTSIFFLNQLFGIPPSNNFHPARLVILVFGAFLPSASEHYAYTISTNPNKRVGTGTWVAVAIIAMEWLIIIKFGLAVPKFHVVPDASVLIPWALFVLGQLLWVCLFLVTKHWPGWYQHTLQPLLRVEQGTTLRVSLCATFVPLLSLTRHWAF